ncbi:hypothetical protein AgCh_031584 [Apium graveolens]
MRWCLLVFPLRGLVCQALKVKKKSTVFSARLSLPSSSDGSFADTLSDSSREHVDEFENVAPFSTSVQHCYPVRSKGLCKNESSPGEEGFFISKTALKTGSSSHTSSVCEVSGPRCGVKLESNKSFNRPSLYSKASLDFDILSKHCVFSDGYAVFSPSAH